MPDQMAVGVDGSAASRAALEWVVAQAERGQSPIVLLHVAGNTSDSIGESESIAATELERVRSLAPHATVSMEIFTGDIVRTLATESRRFDLLAVGTHKTGFLRGRAFGSVSLRLAALAEVPLAVIPISSGRTRIGVSVGIDDLLSSPAVVRYAAKRADATGSALTLIHARTGGAKSPLRSALELVHGEFPNLTVHSREIAGVAGEVLTNAGAAADTLVLGGRSNAAGIGEVGYDVLLNISGPTILVPPQLATPGVDDGEHVRRKLRT